MTKRLVSLMALAVAVASPAMASPPMQMAPKPMTNKTWWPDRLDLSPLRQHAAASNPLGADYNYAEEFKKLDLAAVKADIQKVLTT